MAARKSLVAIPSRNAAPEIRQRHGLPRDHAIGLGVDRLDYTKGLEERFNAVERLLELHPEWIGKFTFIQIAAPTRASIEQYQNYETARPRSGRADQRAFCGSEYPRSFSRRRTTSPSRSTSTTAAADLCFVSSLHDGMNLVAKEFVASRDDDRGVLVLSQFTGAARELPEALIVNPYDADQCAAALNVALYNAAPHPAHPHAADARIGQRVQRLQVGGPDASQCGEQCAVAERFSAGPFSESLGPRSRGYLAGGAGAPNPRRPA